MYVAAAASNHLLGWRGCRVLTRTEAQESGRPRFPSWLPTCCDRVRCLLPLVMPSDVICGLGRGVPTTRGGYENEARVEMRHSAYTVPGRR